MKVDEPTNTASGQAGALAPAVRRECVPDPDASASAKLATRAAVDGVACGAFVAVDFGKRFLGDEVNLDDAFGLLRKSVDAVNGGDLSQVEGMLLSQASALNAIFVALAQRANRALDDVMSTEAVDFNLRLALKAQAQSRATLETLGNIKSPKAVAFVRQANIAHGHQQVNNGGAATPTHAGETKLAPNELLENQHGERLDFGTQGAAGRADPQLATLGGLDRAGERGRQGGFVEERL